MRRQREQEEAYTKTNKNPQLSGLLRLHNMDIMALSFLLIEKQHPHSP